MCSSDLQVQCVTRWREMRRPASSRSQRGMTTSVAAPDPLRAVGDRLYFMEVLTQLHDAVNSWSKLIGQSLTSTRTLPNLQRNGLPLQVVSWNTKEVVIWVEALGLAEWKPAFEKHLIQGDVMFALTEPAFLEIGVTKIGDRLYQDQSVKAALLKDRKSVV